MFPAGACPSCLQGWGYKRDTPNRVARDKNGSVFRMLNMNGRERKAFMSRPVIVGYFPVIFPCDLESYPVDSTVNLQEAERIHTPGGARISHVHTQLPLQTQHTVLVVPYILIYIYIYLYALGCVGSLPLSLYRKPARLNVYPMF